MKENCTGKISLLEARLKEKMKKAAPRGPVPDGDTLSGILERFIFQNPEDGFFIGKVRAGSEEFSVRGYYMDPQLGLQYTFTGEWRSSEQYGPTFHFDTCQPSFPKGIQAIRMYLTNARWVGSVISEILVNKYGEAAIDVCLKEPERVAREVPRLTLERARALSESLVEIDESRDYQLRMLEILSNLPVPKSVWLRIEATYKGDAPEILEKDPYALIGRIRGYGFKMADAIGSRVGIARDSERRIRAGLIYFLEKHIAVDGHVCCPEEVVLSACAVLLNLREGHVGGVMDDMLANGELMLDRGMLATRKLYGIEADIASRIEALMAAQPTGLSTPDYEGLFPDQVEALRRAIEVPVFIITGPPGTGKSHLMRNVIDAFSSLRVRLAAPTGKAAKRLIELVEMKATTIHKLLEAGPIEGVWDEQDENKEEKPEPKDELEKLAILMAEREERMRKKSKQTFFAFTRDELNPLEADLIAIDEASMIDSKLMDKLLRAIKPGTRLILVGDIYQLPPVGAGNVLRDLIHSGRVPYCELTEIKRQDPGMIVLNCHAIKNGEDIEVDNESDRDFFFLEKRFGGDIQDTIANLVCEDIPDKYGFDPMRDIQVLSPTKVKPGSVSCKHLNERLQKELNPDGEVSGIANFPFRVGDKVIQTANDYGRGIINGDIGYVDELDVKGKTISVLFEDREAALALPLFENDLELAYALTIHKFQGSEVPAVVIPIHSGFYKGIAQRSLLYTAISRAQKVCFLVGERHVIPAMIERNSQHDRYTFLRMFLEGDKP